MFKGSITLSRLSCCVALLFYFSCLWSCTGISPNAGIPDEGFENSPLAGLGDEIRESGLVHQDQISQLPQWQIALLEDPGWGQVEVQTPEPTKINPPDIELLQDYLSSREFPDNFPVPEILPRFSTTLSRIVNQAGGIMVGEFPFGPADVIPEYGCNSNPDNASPEGNAIEDLIGSLEIEETPYNHVYSRSSVPNHFSFVNAGNDPPLSVSQAFFDEPFYELAYNASLLGAGIGPGGDCSPVSGAGGPFIISGEIWRRFYSNFYALPNLHDRKLYDVLIAPAGEVSSPVITGGDSVASYQPFFLGSVSKCYGGAWIISIESTTNGCETFSNIFSDPQTSAEAQAFFTNPVYGLLLKRWQDMKFPDQDGPWETELGMPVLGPFAYSAGMAILNGKGRYHAWGEWYERGFIWWIDYDNDGPDAGYPNVPDEAIAYRFSGDNVYCAESGEYQPMPTMYYGDNGTLSTNVVPLGWRIVGDVEWNPMQFNRTSYQVQLQTNQELEVEVQFRAQGFGGVPNNEYLYKHYIWMLGNGFVKPPGAEYDQQQNYALGTYNLVEGETETKYTVKVQVVDEDGFNFAKSFPLVFTREIEE